MQKTTQLSLQALLLAVLLISLTVLGMSASGVLGILEGILLLLLTLSSAAGLIMIKEHVGHQILFVTYIIYFLNLIVLAVALDDVYVVLFLLTIVGAIISLLHDHKHEKKVFVESNQEPHSVVFDTPVKKAKTNYSPGKYVASKNGKFYHEPKSEWALKIKKENQVWFTSKKEALEAGYRAHRDVSA